MGCMTCNNCMEEPRPDWKHEEPNWGLPGFRKSLGLTGPEEPNWGLPRTTLKTVGNALSHSTSTCLSGPGEDWNCNSPR